MDECTTSLDLHFGHYKAGCRDNLISLVHYTMSEIPLRSGYSPSRWEQATDVMILKKAGLYDLDKLRTIVLYEADYNYNNKFLGRAMLKHAMPLDLLATEQYSVPGKEGQ